MAQQMDQFEVYMNMVRAIDAGKHADVKRADSLIRKALLENMKHRFKRSSFYLTEEEASFICKMPLN